MALWDRTAVKDRPRADIADVRPGQYLTDGHRLFHVLALEDDNALVEDCRYPGRAQWRSRQVMLSARAYFLVETPEIAG